MVLSQFSSMEDLIRSSIVLGRASPRGFEILKCGLCNDYKTRAGFKFDNNNVVYSCFNCSTVAVYQENGHKISKKMKDVLLSFGIEESNIDQLISTSFFNANNTFKHVEDSKQKQSFKFPTEIDLPANCTPLHKDNTIWGQVAKEYLKYRNIDTNEHDFYISTHKRYIGRAIIAYKFRNKVIYWQARSLDDSIQPRYINAIESKDNIFFNMDELYRHTTDPLIVTEGFTDAVTFGNNGISIVGSNLSNFKESELKKITNRKIIFIIDKNLNGYKLGEQALKNNWYIYVFSGDLEDANDSIEKMGKLWTINSVIKESKTGLSGKLLLETYVKPLVT